MKNPAANPMHPGHRRFHDDTSHFAGGPARFGAPTPLAGERDAFGAFNEVAAVRDGLRNEALAIGDAPSIAAALGLIARMRGMRGWAAATAIRRQHLCRALGYRRSAARPPRTRGTPGGYRFGHLTPCTRKFLAIK